MTWGTTRKRSRCKSWPNDMTQKKVIPIRAKHLNHPSKQSRFPGGAPCNSVALHHKLLAEFWLGKSCSTAQERGCVAAQELTSARKTLDWTRSRPITFGLKRLNWNPKLSSCIFLYTFSENCEFYVNTKTAHLFPQNIVVNYSSSVRETLVRNLRPALNEKYRRFSLIFK